MRVLPFLTLPQTSPEFLDYCHRFHYDIHYMFGKQDLSKSAVVLNSGSNRTPAKMLGRTWNTLAIMERFQGPPELEIPFRLARGVEIRRTPEWLKADQTHLSKIQRCVLGNPFSFVVEYQANGQGDPDADWSGEVPRSVQEVKLELILLANIAFWLSRPTSLCLRHAFHCFQFHGWAVSQSKILPNILVYQNDQLVLSIDDMRLARRLHHAVVNLSRNSVVWLALSTTWEALKASSWAVRYLMLWVALESLFGPDGGGEIRYRLSQRTAFFLEPDRHGAKKLFGIVNRGYDWRSKVAHGGKGLRKLKPTQSEEIRRQAEDILRRSLIKILTSPDLITKFNGKQREEYLDGLPYQG